MVNISSIKYKTCKLCYLSLEFHIGGWPCDRFRTTTDGRIVAGNDASFKEAESIGIVFMNEVATAGEVS